MAKKTENKCRRCKEKNRNTRVFMFLTTAHDENGKETWSRTEVLSLCRSCAVMLERYLGDLGTKTW